MAGAPAGDPAGAPAGVQQAQMSTAAEWHDLLWWSPILAGSLIFWIPLLPSRPPPTPSTTALSFSSGGGSPTPGRRVILALASQGWPFLTEFQRENLSSGES